MATTQRPVREVPIPHLGGYETRVIQADIGYIGYIKPLDVDSQELYWQSRPFKTIAAAWRTMLRELMRMQGLT